MSDSLTVLSSVAAVRSWRSNYQSNQQTIGFVPTMGALHSGHMSLLRRAKEENSFVICSIFVNPAQFENPHDLSKYPRVENADKALIEAEQVDALFLPSAGELYPDNYQFRVHETELSTSLCGAYRPGHFDGVLSVVLKLLNLVQPTNCYFGEKDYQQLLLIQGMVNAFFIDTKIVGCETVREEDGVALSSRNRRLSPSQRKTAHLFAQLLREEPSRDQFYERLASEQVHIDYLEERWGRRLAAIRLGTGEEEIRLIDNIPWPNHHTAS